MKVTVKSKCRECNGHGYYCDYRCDARGIPCTHRGNNVCDCEYNDGDPTVKSYEVEVDDSMYEQFEKQIDKENSY